VSPAAPAIDDVRREVLRRLADAADLKGEAREISTTASLREDLGLGSLDAVLLVMDLEERLGIDIEDDELASLDTVDTLLELVEAKFRARGPTPL
jgi:acyl carrier protein